MESNNNDFVFDAIMKLVEENKVNICAIESFSKLE